jgi:hypothetical protein
MRTVRFAGDVATSHHSSPLNSRAPDHDHAQRPTSLTVQIPPSTSDDVKELRNVAHIYDRLFRPERNRFHHETPTTGRRLEREAGIKRMESDGISGWNDYFHWYAEHPGLYPTRPQARCPCFHTEGQPAQWDSRETVLSRADARERTRALRARRPSALSPGKHLSPRGGARLSREWRSPAPVPRRDPQPMSTNSPVSKPTLFRENATVGTTSAATGATMLEVPTLTFFKRFTPPSTQDPSNAEAGRGAAAAPADWDTTPPFEADLDPWDTPLSIEHSIAGPQTVTGFLRMSGAYIIMLILSLNATAMFVGDWGISLWSVTKDLSLGLGVLLLLNMALLYFVLYIKSRGLEL